MNTAVSDVTATIRKRMLVGVAGDAPMEARDLLVSRTESPEAGEVRRMYHVRAGRFNPWNRNCEFRLKVFML